MSVVPTKNSVTHTLVSLPAKKMSIPLRSPLIKLKYP